MEIVKEISAYLQHQDYSLAQRRLLDACLDTGDSNLIVDSIAWSREYRLASQGKNAVPAGILEKAKGLLAKIEASKTPEDNRRIALLDAQHISKTYKKGNFSLRPISLYLQTGNIMGVVGENGNGKTTLLRCLAGQLALNSGNIKYALLHNPDYYSIKQHVAFIPQRIPKWFGVLKDNLHFAASLAGIYGNTNRLMVDFMLERLNLSDYANLSWSEISSGYRTRFEIARILLQKPRLLILDEPLANLDINAQQTMLTDLRFIARSLHHSMGIILSSQQLHEVEKIADTVLFIKQGEGKFNAIATTAKPASFILELETTASREQLMEVLGEKEVQLQFNGGFYTVSSTLHSSQQIVQILVSSNIAVTYFRDITYSTKRYF